MVAPVLGHSPDYDYCYYYYYHRLLSYWLLVVADVDCSEYDADDDYDVIHVPWHFVKNRWFRLHRRLLLRVFLVWVNTVPHPIGIASLEWSYRRANSLEKGASNRGDLVRNHYYCHCHCCNS